MTDTKWRGFGTERNTEHIYTKKKTKTQLKAWRMGIKNMKLSEL